MRDNLDGLTDTFNMELKDIRVSEELKLKTLGKCKGSKKNSIGKSILPISCTIAACLFVGVIIYPIYNRENLTQKEQMTMKTRSKEIKPLDKPFIDPEMQENQATITEDENNKTVGKETVQKNPKEANKSNKEEKQQNEMIVLNEKPITPLKMQSSIQSEKEDRDISGEGKNITVATKGEIIDKESTKDDNKSNSLVLSEENDNALDSDKEIRMKNLSLQEARKIFQNNLKIPSYIPKDFVMEKILVPEVDNNSYELYEIIYSNNSQYFKITEYKNINNNAGLTPNSIPQSKVTEENNMIININKTPVKYVLAENVDNKELSYVKLTWESMGIEYSAEGNAPWAELINIVSSIIR